MLSIIVPVFNQHEWTQECLKSVYKHTSDYEVIVIDNGSDPKLHFISGSMDIRVIRNEKNLGFPAAVNQGLKEVRGDTICLLNNDVIVTPHWVEWMSAHFDKVDIIGPSTNYCAGYQRAITPMYDNVNELDNVAIAMHNDRNGMLQKVNYIIGFCMLFRKTLVDEIGNFDDSLWPCSGEEIDFCFRAKKVGYKVGIAHDVYVHHVGSQTFAIIDEDYNEIVKRNEAHLLEKWGVGWSQQVGLPFTGERVIPDNPFTPKTTMQDHIKRYEYALNFVEGKNVLDVACGAGYGSAMLADKAKFVDGGDIDHGTIDYCKDNYIKDNLNFDQFDIRSMSISAKYYDVVVSFETIEHINKDDGILFLNEVNRVLNSNGTFIVSTPIENDNKENAFHLANYTKDEFVALLNKYFEEVDVFYQAHTGDIDKEYPVVEKNSQFFYATFIIAVCKKPRKDV